MKEVFANDIKKMLTEKRKYINHRYVFDEVGDRLFENLMKTEEYYLSKCETEILTTNKEQIKD